MTGLIIKTASSIHEIDSEIWDQLSAGRPFQSHCWYAFGEKVMADSPPTYLLVYNKRDLVARAAFWLIRDEPLPDLQPALRTLAMFLLKRWPLFICRSPLANATGLLLPNGLARKEALSALTDAAKREARIKKASFVVFDYIEEKETRDWPPMFSVAQVSDPGTVMPNHWDSLDDFLADGNKKDRQHYKRTLREANKLGVRLDRHEQVPDIDSAIALIHNVDKRHGNAPNPWMRNLLTYMDKVGGTWLEARVDNRLVGGGLILEDNATQMTTALGLAEEIPYVYFLLIYASLESAFEKKVSLLRWGSGAYDVKQRLGFEMESTNNAAIIATNHFINQIIKKMFSNQVR